MAGRGELTFRSIGAATLSASWLTSEWTIDQAEEALTVQISDRLHLIKKASSLLSVGLSIALSHAAKVFVAFVDSHVIFGGHSSLR